MSFFYSATRSAAAKRTAPKAGGRGVIPIATMRQMGCAACPRDKSQEARTPKLRPSGTNNPLIYLLGAGPSAQDDAEDGHWTDAVGDALYDAFGQRFMTDNVRSNYIVQCLGKDALMEATECCRGRIVADIEETRPVVIVTVGDTPLRWVLEGNEASRQTALIHRGAPIVTKVGRHTCYVLPMIYPNFIHKKKKFGVSEYELAFMRDAADAIALARGNMPVPEPTVYDGRYDAGVEIITGEQPGDFKRLERALADLQREPSIAVDIESNGLRPRTVPGGPILATVAVGTFDRVVAFPVYHNEQGWDTDKRRQIVADMLGEFLLHSGTKVAHNLGMELEWFEFYYGHKLLRETEWDDTMSMAHTLDERPGTKSLNFQTRKHFGFWLKDQSPIDSSRIMAYPLKDVLRYNGMDSKWTHKLRDHLYQNYLLDNPVMLEEHRRKVRLAPTLVITQSIGLPVDEALVDKKMAQFDQELEVLEKRLAKTPEAIKFSRQFGQLQASNNDQILKLYRDVMKRPEVLVEERDGTTRQTTDEEALSKMPPAEVPSAAIILEHRAIAKLNGTYLLPIKEMRALSWMTRRIHSRYDTMRAVTGRLASDDPNIQNFPKRKHKHIREIVVPLPDYEFLACDYGQIEFRVVGMASEDRNLVKACWTGYDVHKFWAERMVDLYPRIKDYIVEVFHVDWDEKGLKTLRQEAKNGWVFPQLFGSSVRSCADQLHLPLDVAEDLAEEFWAEFSGVKKWQERLMKNYERNLYVETLSGRRRRGPMTKNEIINMPIQGTAADIVTTAMCAVSERAYEMDLSYLNPALNVHDDLTYMTPKAERERMVPIIVEEMCKHRYDWINVPLVVEVSHGQDWANLEEIGVFRSDKLFNLDNPFA